MRRTRKRLDQDIYPTPWSPLKRCGSGRKCSISPTTTEAKMLYVSSDAAVRSPPRGREDAQRQTHKDLSAQLRWYNAEAPVTQTWHDMVRKRKRRIIFCLFCTPKYKTSRSYERVPNLLHWWRLQRNADKKRLQYLRYSRTVTPSCVSFRRSSTDITLSTAKHGGGKHWRVQCACLYGNKPPTAPHRPGHEIDS